MGAATAFAGVIDLITMKAYYFDSSDSEDIRRSRLNTETRRLKSVVSICESLSMYSDEMMELLLSEKSTDRTDP
ncbi:MAG: hypothetical protein U0892_07570 [Pirellulales bacterium]